MASTPITLTAGMRKNLFSLQQTQSLLERTQKRLATGQRVNSAVDDPVNYFTALGHRQRCDLGCNSFRFRQGCAFVFQRWYEGDTLLPRRPGHTADCWF